MVGKVGVQSLLYLVMVGCEVVDGSGRRGGGCVGELVNDLSMQLRSGAEIGWGWC